MKKSDIFGLLKVCVPPWIDTLVLMLSRNLASRKLHAKKFGIARCCQGNCEFHDWNVPLCIINIPILLVTEIFLCEAYRFQKTSQTSDAQKNTPNERERVNLTFCLPDFVYLIQELCDSSFI